MRDFIDACISAVHENFMPVNLQFAAKSYTSSRLRTSLRSGISSDDAEMINKTIRYMALKGGNLAMKQPLVKKKLRGVTGRFINEGTYQELVNVNVSLVVSVQQRFLDRLQLLIARFIGGGTITWDKLKKGIKKLGNITEAQAAQIARTEVIRAINVGMKDTFKNLGFKRWRWVTALDEMVCPVCGSLHGKVIEIEKSFTTFRANPIFNPPVHPNCRCSVEVV
jgi:SPP1 gp7 family putative phage head morphogenesis protein